ncbi:MAG: hypothetical protein NVS3B20_13030 [Polyangiales bacterium]
MRAHPNLLAILIGGICGAPLGSSVLGCQGSLDGEGVASGTDSSIETPAPTTDSSIEATDETDPLNGDASGDATSDASGDGASDTPVKVGITYVFVGDGSSKISVFTMDPATAKLTLKSSADSSGNNPYSITTSADLSHLYAANTGSDSIAAFAVDPSSFALTFLNKGEHEAAR